MKELSGTARNYVLVKDDDGMFHPSIELVFVVSELNYRFSVGEMVKDRIPETIRISTNKNGIKKIIEQLKEAEKEFDVLEVEAAAAELCKKQPAAKAQAE